MSVFCYYISSIFDLSFILVHFSVGKKDTKCSKKEKNSKSAKKK